jgi:hypothetical protein
LLNSDKTTLLARVFSWPSYYVFLVCFLIGGVMLCAGSFALQIHDLKYEGRQVGYLWAPNWSLTYAILGPLALYLMLEALKGIRRALDYLFESGMVRDESMAAVSVGLSTMAWRTGTRVRSGLLLVCAGMVPAALAYSEWYPNNLKRLMAGECKRCDLSDFDWGLAAIMPEGRDLLRWPENAAFDFLAFSCEAFLIGATVLCFLYLLDVNQVLPGPEGRVNKLLFPNLRSEDPRRGFQKFAEPLQLMLNASLVVYLICYLIRINRIYMRSPEYSSIISFVQRDINVLVKSKVLDLKGSELVSILLQTPSDPRYQEFFGGIALVLVCLFSLAVIVLTVSGAAKRAKANAEEYYERDDCHSLFGLPIEDERRRAKEMTTWPFEWRYLQLNTLLAMMLVAPVMLWFYRIGFYVFLVFVAAVLVRMRKIGAA